MEHTFPFRKRDIITNFIKGEAGYKERIRVKKVTFRNLSGVCLKDNTPVTFHSSKGLTLLRRPGFRFKVGDQIITLKSHWGIGIGAKGRIIVINPDSAVRFLACFPGWKVGHNGNLLWEEPWFPDEYKKDVYTYFWIGGTPDWVELFKE